MKTNNTDQLIVKVVNKSPHDLPNYQTSQSAGLDLRADIDSAFELKPLQRKLVSTGLYIELPPGFEAQIRPRSGLAYKNGITILNSPGTIDADYRGEIKVLLVNLSEDAFEIVPGDRIAQMIIARHEQAILHTVSLLQESDRDSGGFGSTGTQ